MAIHLQNMHIDCYRGLSNIDLNDFNNVNILVGDNNVGKTSVMEAICALRAPMNLNVWNEIARKKSDYYRGGSFFSAYLNIFPIDEEKKVEFSGTYSELGEYHVVLTAEEYKTTISERERDRINGFMRTGSTKTDETYVDTNVLSLSLQVNDKDFTFDVYDFQMRPPRRINKDEEIETMHNTEFIEPRDGLENDYLYMKKVFLDTEYYEQLIEILGEFDSSITGLISADEQGNIAYYLRSSEHSKAIPVSVYGDGLKKALKIFAALASNKDGVVMIDEVESSIHTSAMNKVFSTLVKWAKALNIQLFISTHSQEALDALLNCEENMQDGINVYTLYKKEKKNYVRKLNCKKAIELQNKMGMELR